MTSWVVADEADDGVRVYDELIGPFESESAAQEFRATYFGEDDPWTRVIEQPLYPDGTPYNTLDPRLISKRWNEITLQPDESE